MDRCRGKKDRCGTFNKNLFRCEESEWLALSSFYADCRGYKDSIDKRDEEDTEIRVT